MSVESHPGLLWCFINSPYDWSKTPAPPSQPIRFKTEGNHDLVTRVFPRFGQFACFYLSQFSSAPCGIVLCYDWLF